MKQALDLKILSELFDKKFSENNQKFLRELDKRFVELEELKKWRDEIRTKVFFPLSTSNKFS